MINFSKSHLEPSCKYLGFIFDSNGQSIAIPPRRRKKLLCLTAGLARRTRCLIREFASFIGSFISQFAQQFSTDSFIPRHSREKF